MQIVQVAIRLIVQQSYGLGVDAVKEPFGPRLGEPVQLAVRQHREQSMTWVTGVFDNFLGLPLTPPGIQVLVIQWGLDEVIVYCVSGSGIFLKKERGY